MKLLFVVPEMGYGGAERVTSILCNSFADGGNEVKILFINPVGESVYPLNENIEIEVVHPASWKKFFSVCRLLNSVRRITRMYDPDIILTFMSNSCAVAALANLGARYPIIYSERCDPSNTYKELKEKFYKTLIQIFSTGFVFQSEGAKALYSTNIQKKSTIILNPINVQNLPSHYSGERKKEIVSVGRLHPQKNQSMLIRAFSCIAQEYPDYKLLIYGDGELKQALQQQIDDLGLHGKAILKNPIPNILECMSTASVFALSSDYEGLPNTLIEAMSLGLPCISTDCSPGGAAMLIDNNVNGILVPAGNEMKFAEGLRYLLLNKQKAIEMGDEAKKIIAKTNEKKIITEWENYISLIAQKGKVKFKGKENI